jgi:hypothetical protein
MNKKNIIIVLSVLFLLASATAFIPYNDMKPEIPKGFVFNDCQGYGSSILEVIEDYENLECFPYSYELFIEVND